MMIDYLEFHKNLSATLDVDKVPTRHQEVHINSSLNEEWEETGTSKAIECLVDKNRKEMEGLHSKLVKDVEAS
jgi:hypothetical protein